MMVGVDHEAAVKVGRLLRPLRNSIHVDDFTDEALYPPRSAPREDVAMYFLVMVAMDHRLSRPSKPYEAVIDGRLYHGADLLYRLGRIKMEEDPDFFTAERLSRVTERDVLEWLSVGGARPPDPSLRARLLRDLGEKLLKLYDGSAFRIIAESRARLRNPPEAGFLDRLKVFAAYQDPVEKKPLLLAKFLERRGVLQVDDPWNKDVPVDNHLARIAVRTGIVRVDKETLEKIAAGIEFSPEEDVMLRYAARLAWRIVAQESGIDPFILDDFLWMFGRKCCTRDSPACRSGCVEGCQAIGGCRGGTCVLRPVCRAASDPLYMVPEHKFLETWWY